MTIETIDLKATKLFLVAEVHGLYADAFVTDGSAHLLFASFWGRDTVLQELLARLSLAVSEGGLSRLQLSDPDDSSCEQEALIGNADRLMKTTGRMPKSNLFGDMVQLWLYDRLAIQPDYASRRALRICRQEDDEVNVDNTVKRALENDLTWNLMKEVSSLPLLDHWREPVVHRARQQGWISFHAGQGIDALTLHLSDKDFEPAMEAMVRGGTLALSEGLPEREAEIKASLNEKKPRLSPEQLTEQLACFTGTQVWTRHALVRDMTYTDGVKFFAEEGGDQGAYWFLDLVATEVFGLLERNPFLFLAITVKECKAELVVEDGNGGCLLNRSIEFTDLQDGEWQFYLTDNVLLLPSEY